MCSHAGSYLGKAIASILLLSLFFIQIGCYTYIAGPVVRTDEVPGSQHIDSCTYQIKLDEEPTFYRTSTWLSVTKTPMIRFMKVEEGREMRRPNVGLCYGLFWGGLGVAVVAKQLNKGVEPQLAITASLFFSGIAVAGGSLIFLAVTNHGRLVGDDSTYELTGDLVSGRPLPAFKSGMALPLANCDVTVRVGERSRNYTTDQNGKFNLDPVKDFGLVYFSVPSTITLSVSADSVGYMQRLALDPKEWTEKRIRVESESATLRKTAKLVAQKVGTISQGDEYAVIDELGGFFSISGHGHDGWISKSDCVVFWSAKNRLNPDRLPKLNADLKFAEPSGQGILHADQAGTITVSVTNTGKGDAYGVSGTIAPASSLNLEYKSLLDIGDIAPGETKQITVPVTALKSVSSDTVTLRFTFNEANGFEPDPVQITFQTREFVPPRLAVADVGVEEADGGNVIHPGRLAIITVRIQNAGSGEAKDVNASVRVGQDVFMAEGSDTSFSVGNLTPGEYKDIKFSLYTNNRATDVPVYVDLTEHYGDYGLSNYKLPLAFNKPMAKLNEIVVQPKEQQTQTVEISKGLSIDVDSNIPQARQQNSNAVALILSISDYQGSGISRVKYARNDAEVLRQYLIKSLGFKPENILPMIPDEQLTYGRIQTYIKSILPSYLKPDGSSDLFIYFTGHGAPSTANHEAYLVPWDGDPNYVNDNNSYSMKKFYVDIELLNARHKIIVVDACFSGYSGSGETLLKSASPIYLKLNNPLVADPNTVIFQSSSVDQVSNWYNEKRHGMFTYFFLKGLQGAADFNHDGTITADELIKYINDQNDGLPYYSNRLYQRPQEAQLEGNGQTVIERIEK